MSVLLGTEEIFLILANSVFQEMGRGGIVFTRNVIRLSVSSLQCSLP